MEDFLGSDAGTHKQYDRSRRPALYRCAILTWMLSSFGAHVDKITNLRNIFTAPCIMILRREIHITWVIVIVVLKVSPVLGPGIALATPVLGPGITLATPVLGPGIPGLVPLLGLRAWARQVKASSPWVHFFVTSLCIVCGECDASLVPITWPAATPSCCGFYAPPPWCSCIFCVVWGYPSLEASPSHETIHL